MISVDDLKDYTVRTQIFGEFNRRKSASVYLVCDPVNKRIHFTVESYHKQIAAVPDLQDAIDLFNNL